ncbi:MAG: VWA domain-containing protein [Oscillospiraceae bacterium]
MIKRAFRTLTIFIMLAALMCGGATAVVVEQVQLCMPSVDVYLYESNDELSTLKAEDISASLGGAPLAVKSFGRAEQGIYYVYMLDVSASMPNGHFAAAKLAVAEACARLREQDSLALITFGSDVRLPLRGGESAEKIKATIDALKNTDGSTKFYTAMNALTELAAETEDMRRVAVVISDGIDDTDAGMTQDELEQKLLRAGVSVSGLCIDTSSADVENFTELIHISGGELYTYGEDDAVAVLDSLLDKLEGGWHLELEAPTNVADGKATTLSVDFGGEKLELPVTPQEHVPDDKPPRVESAVYDRAANTIALAFSEPVADIASAAAYSLMTDAGKSLEIASVEALSPSECRVVPALPLPEKGSVAISVSGLRDLSMEQNEMYKYSNTVYSEKAVTATSAPGETPEDEPFISAGTIIILCAVLLLAAVAAVTIVKLSGKKTAKTADVSKKRRKQQAITVKREKETAAQADAVFMFLDSDGRHEKKEVKDDE